ncbi:MAG: cytochrome c oxidase subunit II [Armatimonadota bacterium]|nr:cytochrome c oxidase subunit II [Armatimonadota bacterium]MDR7534602.1 cytochrome c oxidase subunit II [Armatimonadota bacterium]MDR7536239.1 cytochrome c oxidase subunit II [Armatimonadota bacterium]
MPTHADGDERRTAARVAALIAATMVAGVAFTLLARGRWWLPPVASVHGVLIDRLFYSTLWITGAIFILVHAFLGYLVWRHGARGDERAAHWHEHRRLELTYTIVPAVGLAVMVSMSAVVWSRIHSAPPADAMVVEVRGEQFAWMARYPGPDGTFGRTDPRLIDLRRNPFGLDPADPAAADDVVSRDLHLVVDRPVRVRVRARDVIHSFFIAEFRVKQDAVPGMTVETWFTPTRTGTYEIACAELCGVGHYVMRGRVVVERQAAFDAWLGQQRPALQRPQ